MKSESPQGAELNVSEHFNKVSFEAYRQNRNTAFDLRAARRADQNVRVNHARHAPETIIPYEMQLANTNLELANLWGILLKAKDLMQMFKTTRDFLAWYNGSDHAPVAQAERPRELAFRCFSDLYGVNSDNGLTVAIENQTLDTLVLDDYIDWYGWPVVCSVPTRIEPMSTTYFDVSYSGFYNTAARCCRYKMLDTGWYAYIAAYTYRFGSNCSYVLLSQERITDWNTIYDALKTQSSFSKPEGCKYLMNSNIDWNYKAKSVFQIALQEYEGIMTKIEYYLANWATPKDYKNEL